VHARERFHGGSCKAYLDRIARNRRLDQFRGPSLWPVTDPEHCPGVVDPALSLSHGFLEDLAQPRAGRVPSDEGKRRGSWHDV